VPKTWIKKFITQSLQDSFLYLSVILVVLRKEEVNMSGFIRKSAFKLKKHTIQHSTH